MPFQSCCEGHFLSRAIMSFVTLTDKTINRHITDFTNNVECSNICGNFTVKYFFCGDCEPTYLSCVMKIKCAVQKLEIGMDDEIKLDCFEPWHRITSNFHSYIYFRGPLGTRNKWQLEQLRETDESSLVILQVKEEHQQTYLCVVMGNEGSSIAETFYDVTVGERILIPTETGKTHPPLVQEEGLELQSPTRVHNNSTLILNLFSLMAIVVLSVLLLAFGGYLCYQRLQQHRNKDNKMDEVMQFIK